MARVDGDSITVAQVLAQTGRIHATDNEDPDAYRHRLLEPLIHRLLLKHEARREGFYENPEVLARLDEAVGAELRRRLSEGAEGQGAQDELRAQLLAESHFELDDEAVAALAAAIEAFDTKDPAAYDGPLVAPGAIDTSRVLFTSDLGPYTVADFLAGAGSKRTIYNATWSHDAERLGADLGRNHVNAISPLVARRRGLDQTADFEAWREERHEEFAVMHLYQTQVLDAVRPSEGEIRSYYEAHPERYRSPDMVSTDAWSFTDSTDARRIERAMRQELPAQVVESLARGSRSFGMQQRLRQPLERLETAAGGPVAPGDIVCDIRVGTSWVHRVLDINPGEVRPFESVAEEVRHTLEDQRAEERLQEILDGARARAEIDIDEALLAEVPV
ncbi:MAG: peptidylprolyl isomerase [Candidatus Eiseniibacteriota bacterium]